MHYPAKGIDWDKVPLGSKPDTHIACDLGVAPQVVHKARNRRGIPRFESERARRRREVDWPCIDLGREPDRVLAGRLGLDTRVVCAERRKRGIPAFVGLVLTQEGMPCRSIYEAMYDACLHEDRVMHEHEVAVPGLPFIADFAVAAGYVEIAAMSGFGRYRAKVARKRRAYEQAGIDVQWLGPEDVERQFATCSLSLKFRDSRSCADCGQRTRDLVKHVCRPCYMRRWHRANGMYQACEGCGEPQSRVGRFCSRVCYWTSMELEWPSWDELDRLLARGSIAATARALGVKPTALYMRLRRRREREHLSC